MIKQYLLPLCVLSAATSFAQITVTSADMPNAGDSVKVSVSNSTAGEDQRLTGANYTWDFSALTPNNQRYEKFDNSSTFPSPYNLVFNPFNTTYGKNNYQNTGSVVPGFSIDAAYDFFKESTVNFRQVGAAYTINGTPIPFLYQKPDTIYEFPMNYMNTDSCDYKFGLNIPTFGYYGQKGHRVNVVDGWGTLTTPFGTFPVLRVKSSIMAVDTVYSSSFGFGTNIPRPLRHEYKWIANGKKIPLLYVDENGGTVTSVVYIDSIRADVPQVGISEKTNTVDLAVYPNPANEQLTVQYTLAAATSIQVSIINTLGQTIAVVANGNVAAGKQSLTIDLNTLNLAPGIYGVCFDSNRLREVKSVVITR
jgi:hypothetical protein